MITGSTGYNYPGVYGQGGAPALGSAAAYMGKGPIAAFIIGSSGTITTTAGPSTGVQQTQITSLSGTIIEQSSSFTGNAYSIVLASTDLALYANVALTLINNSANVLQSCSLEWSPNNSQFETWDTTSFAGLGVGLVKSMQILGNSRRYFRVRAIPSGSGGQLTGSLDVFIHANVG